MQELDEHITTIVRSIWTSLFDTDVEPTWSAASLAATRSVTGMVTIEGAWRGAVMVRCGLPLASLLTARMFAVESEPAFDDIADAIGELANIVAGNLKALLPGPSAISLPAVALGVDYEVSVIGTSVVANVAFVTVGHTFAVVVTQSDSGEPEKGRSGGR